MLMDQRGVVMKRVISIAALMLVGTGGIATAMVTTMPIGPYPHPFCNGLGLDPGGTRFDGDDDDDVINGTGDGDLINGGGGNDTVTGRGGGDCIFGQLGDDDLRGNAV